MRSINILAIQRISPDDRAKVEASDPAILLIDAGGWFEGEIRERLDRFRGFTLPAARRNRIGQPRGNATVSSAKRRDSMGRAARKWQLRRCI